MCASLIYVQLILFISYFDTPVLKAKLKKNSNLQLILGLLVLDPDFSLRLWVNKEGEAGSFGDNDAILNGKVITGEPLSDDKEPPCLLE